MKDKNPPKPLKQLIRRGRVYRLQDIRFTAKEWSELLKKAKTSALEQHFAYAASEGITEHKKIIRLGIYRDEDLVAVMQGVIYPLILGIFRLIKISRAPIFLESMVLPDIKRISLELLRKGFSRFRGDFVVLTPDWVDTQTHQNLLSETSFHRFSEGSSSARINLNQAHSKLYKNLRSGFRHSLKKAEKANLTVSDSLVFLDWFLNLYAVNLAAKGFYGESVTFIRTFQELCPMEDFIFRVILEKERPLAGVMIVRHGRGATYWHGHTTDRGRDLNAHHLLLWQTILDLKSDGTEFFDVGGLHLASEKNPHSPGLDAFKSALGGEEYQLVGTYV